MFVLNSAENDTKRRANTEGGSFGISLRIYDLLFQPVKLKMRTRRNSGALHRHGTRPADFHHRLCLSEIGWFGWPFVSEGVEHKRGNWPL